MTAMEQLLPVSDRKNNAQTWPAASTSRCSSSIALWMEKWRSRTLPGLSWLTSTRGSSNLRSWRPLGAVAGSSGVYSAWPKVALSKMVCRPLPQAALSAAPQSSRWQGGWGRLYHPLPCRMSVSELSGRQLSRESRAGAFHPCSGPAISYLPPALFQSSHGAPVKPHTKKKGPEPLLFRI